jgi:hypothetical protein
MNIHGKSPPAKANPRQQFTRGAKKILLSTQFQVLELLLAALISHRARSFAGRLAGSLAFAATAGQRSFGQRSIIDCLNVFSHSIFPSPVHHICYFIVFCQDRQ